MKKVTGKNADEHYESVTQDGEIVERRPEFNKMSLKPGIGAGWYQKFKTDVYPHDYVVVNGKKVKPPRFYDNKYRSEFPLEFEDIQFHREMDARSRFLDNTDERLAVKEQVTLAQVARLPRSLS